MSLLADLLSKVKHHEQKGGIPPTLGNTILDVKKKKNIKRQITIIGGLAGFMVLAGFGVVYYTNVIMEPSSFSTQVRADIQPPLQPQKIEPGQPEASHVSVDKTADKIVVKAEQNPIGNADKIVSKKTTGINPVQALQRDGADVFSGKKTHAASGSPVIPGRDIVRQTNESTDLQRTERDGFLYTAKNCEADKDYFQALDYYKKALEIDRRNYAIMNNISSLLIKTGLYEEAVKQSRAALNINKNHVPSIINIGISFIRLGNREQGETYLLKAVSLEPSNKNALLNLALLYEKSKDYVEANKIYLRLYQMENIGGYLGIARIAENTNRPDDAKKTYREILTLNDLDYKTKKIVSERLTILESK